MNVVLHRADEHTHFCDINISLCMAVLCWRAIEITRRVRDC